MLHKVSASVMAALLLSVSNSSYAERNWIEVNNASLRYDLTERVGKTTPVVLLHEIGMSIEGWDEIMPSLSKQRQVLRYDLRGFGQSEKIRGTFTMADQVADLKGLLDGLHLDQPVVLVGAAIGGTIALKFAAQYPERVKALVLVSPIFNPPRAVGAAAPAVPATPASANPASATPAPTGAAPVAGAARNVDTATLIETQGMRVYLQQQLDSLYPASLRTNPQRLARFYGIQLASDPNSRAATVRMASQNGDVSAELAQVKCPTLVVATSLFALRPAATVKAVAEAMPNAQFVDLPTGHLAALESPELLSSTLLRFFNDAHL